MIVTSESNPRSPLSPAHFRLPLCSKWLLLLLAFCLTRSAEAQVKPAVAYTGKTYGYLRNDASNKPQGILVTDFITTYRNMRTLYPQVILVGMGDNFAPDYLARYVRKNGVDIPVDRKGADSPVVSFFKKFDQNAGAKTGQGDVGYDALVPGQLDFYFGAEFLRRVGSNSGPNLPMVAANLVIQSTTPPVTPQPLCAQPQFILPTQVSLPLQSNSGSGGGKGKGGGGKKGGGGGGGASGGTSGSSSGQGGGQSGQSGQLCLQPRTGGPQGGTGLTLLTPSADSVYPWVSEFEFSVPSGSGYDIDNPLLCPWSVDRNNNNDCKPLATPRKLKNSYLAEVKDNDLALTMPDITYPDRDGTLRQTQAQTQTQILHSGADIELCIPTADPNKSLLCSSQPIRVQNAFFDRGWKTVRRVVGRETINYAVFAVLDPAIMGLISPENYSWSKDNQYTAQIKILDPAPALTQLITAFRRLHDGQQWTYILLAQMQRAQAQALASNLRWHQQHVPPPLSGDPKYNYRFQTIISAADYDEATPDVKLTLHPDPGAQVPPATGGSPILEPPPTPILTPHPIVTEDVMRDPLALVEIDDSKSGTTTYDNYNFHLATTGHWTDRCDSYDKIFDVLNNAALNHLADFAGITKAKLQGTPNATCIGKSAFQCFALKTMRDQLEADAAILQSRDFYSNCNYEGPLNLTSTTPPSNEMVQRVLWNSGYLTRASVSGTTLKAILQASDNLAKQDQSSTNQPLARGRDLIWIGITKSSGLYYINGAALEDSKIYSIATSDQLALGDSSYPQFAQPDLVVPTVFTDAHKQTFAISDLAASAFPVGSKQPLSRVDIVAVLPPGITANKPFDPPKPKGPFPPPFDKDKEPVVNTLQNRPVLSATLQQASLGYTNSTPSQTDSNIATNLAGVTNPNVVSPHSDSLSYSDSFRLLYQRTPHWNIGFDQFLQFARSRQGSVTVISPSTKPPVTTTGAPVPLETINLSANTLIVSPFIEFQPHRYQGHHWKAVGRPITFTSGVSRTLQFLATGTTGVQYELNLRRQENWQPSFGGRYEWSNLTFFEAGYLFQSARNVLASLFVNGKPIPLTAGTTISEVVSGTKPPTDVIGPPGYATFHQQGAYWLGMWTQNLTGKSKAVKVIYQGYTFGNFFAYGPAATTSTALTRYAAELSSNLQVQLWGNFSVGPAYNIFWFQNQSHSIGNSLTRRDWNIQVNYSFDWHQGLEWKDVLEGKTQ